MVCGKFEALTWPPCDPDLGPVEPPRTILVSKFVSHHQGCRRLLVWMGQAVQQQVEDQQNIRQHNQYGDAAFSFYRLVYATCSFHRFNKFREF